MGYPSMEPSSPSLLQFMVVGGVRGSFLAHSPEMDQISPGCHLAQLGHWFYWFPPG